MKTKITIILMAATLLATLTGCGETAALARASSLTESAVSQSESAVAALAPPDKTLALFNKSATLSETVLVEENGVKITAIGLTYTAYSVDLELTIENNSGKDLTFISGSLGYSCNSINGIMVNEGYLNCDVASGKKANDVMSFDYDTLQFYGINEIADMEIAFDMTDDEYNSTYSGPCPLKTSAADTHDYSANLYQETITSVAAMNTFGYEMVCFGQDAIYDQNGVILRSSGILRNQDGKTALLLELENTTDSMVYMGTSNIKINDLVVSSSTWSRDAINPGKRRVVEVQLSSVFNSSCWSTYGITEVGSVALSLEQFSEEGVPLAAKTPVAVIVPGASVSVDAAGSEIYNGNGLRIVSKAVQEDPSDFSADLQLLLLAENTSGRTLTIADTYDSLSVNGVMTDYSFYSQELADGESTALVVRLWESSLEDNQITSSADVQEVEMGFEIREGYTIIDEPVVTIVFGK